MATPYDDAWRQFWMAEGYTLDEVGAAPAGKKAKRRFFKYVDYVEMEKKAREDFLSGMTLILSNKRK